MSLIQDINHPTEPFISVLIYNYDGYYLRELLNSIASQAILTNLEIILIDDATTDGSWEIASDFSNRYPGLLSLQRNRRPLGQKTNKKNAANMAKGRFIALITDDQPFNASYIRSCALSMLQDPYLKCEIVHRTHEGYIPPPSVCKKPLASILCYNYNYGRYLRDCLESVFNQTYENIELCFSDNASTDESWEIACEFQKKYARRMFITRNRRNFGPDANFANCIQNMSGKYFINFCSDDRMEPSYIEACVEAMEAYPNTGLAIVNRSVIDEFGNKTLEAPFYNRSCVIPGPEQAAVYMMAGINPSVSQIMYRRSIIGNKPAKGSLASRYYGTRILDFNIALEHDVVYIKEDLLQHRIHGSSDTSSADSNLLPVIGLYVLNHQFSDAAAVFDLAKVTSRLPESITKLSKLSLRYCLRSLQAGHEPVAMRYFHLATAMSPEIHQDPAWKDLEGYWSASPVERQQILAKYDKLDNFSTRSVSYDPPQGSIDLNMNCFKSEARPQLAHAVAEP